uniref:Cyclin B1 interacting protein 1 n=1 Tax=Salarias fasciatus TaxID=181472 RepID=A0A672GN78_SALFA
MSLCDDTLLCNFPKCRIKLSGFAWVTACSHVFCNLHGSGELSRCPAICPACGSALSGKLDIARKELSPSEGYKAMVLAGLRPDIILDISSRAMAFWSYQVQQEHMYQEYNLSRAEAQVKQMEKMLTQQNQSRELEMSAMRGEIVSLKKVMEEYKKKYSEVSERLMERNRQCQKLQGLYDSLKLRNMVVGAGDREINEPIAYVREFSVSNNEEHPSRLPRVPQGRLGRPRPRGARSSSPLAPKPRVESSPARKPREEKASSSALLPGIKAGPSTTSTE